MPLPPTAFVSLLPVPGAREGWVCRAGVLNPIPSLSPSMSSVPIPVPCLLSCLQPCPCACLLSLSPFLVLAPCSYPCARFPFPSIFPVLISVQSPLPLTPFSFPSSFPRTFFSVLNPLPSSLLSSLSHLYLVPIPAHCSHPSFPTFSPLPMSLSHSQSPGSTVTFRATTIARLVAVHCSRAEPPLVSLEPPLPLPPSSLRSAAGSWWSGAAFPRSWAI